jgi:hypothetical protein
LYYKSKVFFLSHDIVIVTPFDQDAYRRNTKEKEPNLDFFLNYKSEIFTIHYSV